MMVYFLFPNQSLGSNSIDEVESHLAKEGFAAVAGAARARGAVEEHEGWRTQPRFNDLRDSTARMPTSNSL
ncbi:hypothetical protein JYU34_011269 [Plutella xylostella]|uniref:Uncharacterized protein n=1 Tax=Plutella xylostella TaxID=51655 RepID=A0ABQ7QGI1_PLUXY|nr:hypothetical protein JYU34_011269 [Plutella xylostella]